MVNSLLQNVYAFQLISGMLEFSVDDNKIYRIEFLWSPFIK